MPPKFTQTRSEIRCYPASDQNSLVAPADGASTQYRRVDARAGLVAKTFDIDTVALNGRNQRSGPRRHLALRKRRDGATRRLQNDA